MNLSMYLAAKKVDIEDGEAHVAVLHRLDAEHRGFHIGDKLELIVQRGSEYKSYNVDVRMSESIVNPGQIGIFSDDWEEKQLSAGEPIKLKLLQPSLSVEYIRQKIKGEELSYEKMYTIVDDIAKHRISEILATYFLSAFYTTGFSENEIYFLTKAMAETGEMLKFPDKIVADKHSIGGVGGKGVTPIVVSIAMAAGLLVPNTSTKAITTASATTDMLESIMPMSFTKEQLEGFVEEIGGFMVWGGGLDLAPADDVMINVEKPLHLESFDKFTASIIAKKVAQGVNHLVIDLPKGPGTKVKREADVNQVRDKFHKLAKKFDIKIDTYDRFVDGVDGNAVGPLLEVREFLYVLEQHPSRSMQLEELSVLLAAKLIELTEKVSKGNGKAKAIELLKSGKALEKLRAIVKIQGGNPEISSDSLVLSEISFDIIANEDFIVDYQDNKEIFKVCRALGNPYAKKSGVYFYVRANAQVKKGDKLATLYAETQDRLDLGKSVWEKVSVFGKRVTSNQ